METQGTSLQVALMVHKQKPVSAVSEDVMSLKRWQKGCPKLREILDLVKGSC